MHPLSVFPSKTHYQELRLGRVEALCTIQYREKKLIKLKIRFFLRLHNRGFKKYVLKTLFQHVTYSQRNELLNSNTSLPIVCDSLTLQEAELKIIQEGEETFNLSQGTEALSLADPQISTDNAIVLFTSKNDQTHSKTTGLLPGIMSTKG